MVNSENFNIEDLELKVNSTLEELEKSKSLLPLQRVGRELTSLEKSNLQFASSFIDKVNSFKEEAIALLKQKKITDIIFPLVRSVKSNNLYDVSSIITPALKKAIISGEIELSPNPFLFTAIVQEVSSSLSE